MESESRLSLFFGKITDWLNEQSAFQQLKAKWEEWDPQTRMYVKLGLALSITLLVTGAAASTIWSVHRLKGDVNDKTQLVQLIKTANDELRKLRESNPGVAEAGADGGDANWGTFFNAVATTSGLDPASVTVGKQQAGASTELAKEELIEINLKRINVKQLARFAFGLENGSKPVKLRAMNVNAHEDASGYLDATLSVSAFNLKPPGG